MALTITSVAPNSGLTGGREFVLIEGTDFNIAVNADGSAKMEAYFGNNLASRVRVRSATELDCLTPIHDLTSTAVAVKVKDLVTLDEATLPTAFSFARPIIGGGTNSELWHVVDSLVREFKRQIIDEVVIGSSVDFDDDYADGLNIIKLAKTPAIVLYGPNVVGSGGALHRSVEPWEYVGGGFYEKHRPQDVCDLRFTLHGVDTNKIRITNLLKEVVSFFRRNAVLTCLRDPDTPGLGTVDIDMRPEQPMAWALTTRANSKDLKHFTGRFTLFGVPLGHDEIYDKVAGGDETEGTEIDFVLEETEPL